MNEHTTFALGILLGNPARLDAALTFMRVLDRRWVWQKLSYMFGIWWDDKEGPYNFYVRCQLDIQPEQIEWEEICCFFDDVLDDMDEAAEWKEENE